MSRTIRVRDSFPLLQNLFCTVAVVSFAIGALWPSCPAAAETPVLVTPGSSSLLQVAIDLPESFKAKPDQRWQLVEIAEPSVAVAAQLVPAIADDGSPAEGRLRLVANIPARKSIAGPRRFRLQPAKDSAKGKFRFEEVNDKSLKFIEDQAPVMVYNHGVITCEKVPERDHRRSRGCYIHPVWGLDGEVLTDDFPRDHYHHHGIFWTWPHVEIEGKHHDLWSGNTIRDEFVGWIVRDAGPVAAVLAVENGWFVGEKKVMTERVWMRAYKANETTRAIDLEFTWIPVEKPITLRGAGGKSYGGLTMRLAVKNARQSIVSTPGGRSKQDLKETPLPWADLTDKFSDGDNLSGAAIFVHPGHPDFPPTWLTRHYGPLCVGWPGVKAKTFEPGKPLRTSYRILIHKGELSVEQLKHVYEGYTQTAKATWE